MTDRPSKKPTPGELAAWLRELVDNPDDEFVDNRAFEIDLCLTAAAELERLADALEAAERRAEDGLTLDDVCGSLRGFASEIERLRDAELIAFGMAPMCCPYPPSNPSKGEPMIWRDRLNNGTWWMSSWDVELSREEADLGNGSMPILTPAARAALLAAKEAGRG